MSNTFQGTAVFGDFLAQVTATWTSGTSLNATLVLGVQGYGVVQAAAIITAPLTAGSLIFEVSDDGGTTWWPINGVQTGSFTAVTSFSLNGTSSTSWDFAVGAYTNFRIRLNPVITGAGNVIVRCQAESLPKDGTIVVGQGTSPWIVSSVSEGATGSAVPASADYKGLNIGGNLRGQTGVNPTGSVYAAQTDITSVNDVSLGSPSAYGTSPGAVNVMGVNAYVTNTVPITLTSTTITGTVAATQSGTWTATVTQATAANLNATVVFPSAQAVTLTSTTITGTVAVADVNLATCVGTAGTLIGGASTAAPAGSVLTGSIFTNSTTPISLTSGQQMGLQCDTVGAIYVNKDSRRNTFMATTGAFTPIVATTYPIWTLKGSASHTVRITRIRISCYCSLGTTLPATVTLQRLSAMSGGTPVTATPISMDFYNTGSTAVCSTYPVTLPTSHTVMGTVYIEALSWLTASATPLEAVSSLEWCFGNDGGQHLVLRGNAQYAALLLSAVGGTPVMFITVEWIEDNS